MGKKQSAPAPIVLPQAATPDPGKVAREEAQVNRPDIYSPDQNVRHGYTDSAGKFVQGPAPKGRQSAVNVTENPFQKKMRSISEPSAKRTAQQVANQNKNLKTIKKTGPKLNNKNLTVRGPKLNNKLLAVSSTPLPPSAKRQGRDNIGQQIFDRAYSMVSPAHEQQDRRHFTSLQARGLPIGARASNEHFGNVQREREEGLNRLALDADIAGGAEESRVFGLDMAARQQAKGEQAQNLSMDQIIRQQAMSEQQHNMGMDRGIRNQAMTQQQHNLNMDQTIRNQSLGELASMFGGGYTPAQTMGAPNVQPVNLSGLAGQNAGAQGQAAMANAQMLQQTQMANAATNNQTMGMIGSLAGTLGAAAIFSDRRVKTNISRVGTTRGGTAIYQYRYVWDEPSVSRFGVMADEVPHAAIKGPGGMMVVDYAKVA